MIPTKREFLLLLLLVLIIGKAHASCREASVEVEVKRPLSLPTMAVDINGVKTRALLDSGATNTSIFANAEITKIIRAAKSSAHTMALAGDVEVRKADGATLTIGEVASVTALRIIDSKLDDPALSAIAGYDAFPKRWRLDLAERVFAAPIKDCKFPGNKDYILDYQLPLANTQSGRIIIPVRINGVNMRALLDTGSAYTTIFMSAAKRAGFTHDNSFKPSEAYSRGADGVSKRASDGKFSFHLGNEVYPEVLLRVIDDLPRQSIDDIQVLLGTDWLHAHAIAIDQGINVLSVKKASFVPFKTRPDEVERWVEVEASKGMPAAQYEIAVFLLRSGRRSDGLAQLEKAGANGSVEANYLLGRMSVLKGRYDNAAMHLRAALRSRPEHIWSAIWLFLALQRQGNYADANATINAAVKSSSEAWPKHIAQYLAGSMPPEQLMIHAEQDNAMRCDAYMYVSEGLAARKQAEEASAWRSKGKSECSKLTPGW